MEVLGGDGEKERLRRLDGPLPLTSLPSVAEGAAEFTGPVGDWLLDGRWYLTSDLQLGGAKDGERCVLGDEEEMEMWGGKMAVTGGSMTCSRYSASLMTVVPAAPERKTCPRPSNGARLQGVDRQPAEFISSPISTGRFQKYRMNGTRPTTCH